VLVSLLRRVRAVVFVVLALAASLSVTGTASAVGETISGTVRAAGGTPVANVHVDLRTYRASPNLPSTQVGQAVTDANGNYSIPVAPGAYSLLYFVQPYTGLATSWLGPNGTTVAGEFEATKLTIAPGASAVVDATLLAGGTMDGAISLGGSPLGFELAAVEVYAATGPGQASPPIAGYRNNTSTGYAFSVPPGSYKLRVRGRPGSGAASAWIGSAGPVASFGEAVSIPVSIGGVSTRSVELQPGGEVRGIVSGPSGPVTLGQVGVQAFHPANPSGFGLEATSTSGDGSYVVSGLPAGPFVLRFSVITGNLTSAWGGPSGPVAVVQQARVFAMPPSVTTYDIALQAPSIVGTLTRASTGTPVAPGQASVLFFPAATQGPPAVAVGVSTGGRFSVGGLNGSYRIQFRGTPNSGLASGYWTPGGLVDLAADATVVTVGPGDTAVADASLAAGGQFQGIVSPAPASPTEAIVVAARIDAPNTPPSLFFATGVAVNGAYTLAGLPVGQWRLQFITQSPTLRGAYGGPGGTPVFQATQAATQAIAAGATTAYNITLPPATAPGLPTNVTATPHNGRVTVSWSAPVDDGGRAITSYVVTVSPTGNVVTVPAGQQSVTIDGLPNNVGLVFGVAALNQVGQGPTASTAPVVPAAIRGRVTSTSVVPFDLSRVIVEAYPAGGTGIGPAARAQQIDASGTYRLSPPPGAYKLRFRATPGSNLATAWWTASGPVTTFAEADTVTVPTAPADAVVADLALAGGGAIAGTVAGAPFGLGEVFAVVYPASVTDPAGVPPLANAIVLANGAYAVGGLPYGTYKIVFASPSGSRTSGAGSPSGTLTGWADAVVLNVAPEGPTVTYDVELRDVDPPTITVPANVVVDATSAAGATVTFAATATDNLGPVPPTVSCTRDSGSTFAVGTTTVSCTATDVAGNQASASFTVTVRGAAAQLDELAATFEAFDLPRAGDRKAMKEIADAVRRLAEDRTDQACRDLDQLVKKTDKYLTAAQQVEVAADVTRIRAVIGC
jgi:hypothetical protein